MAKKTKRKRTGKPQEPLLDQVLSTGKRLRDSTFAEVRREGMYLLAIAKAGAKAMVKEGAKGRPSKKKR